MDYESQGMARIMRNNKGQFVAGKELSESKKHWWKNMPEDKKKELLKKYSDSNDRRFLGKKGSLSPTWKGERKIDKRDGYVLIWSPDHPFARKNSKGGGGYVLEHRLVMENIIGRYLYPDEDVNHINGIKDDNRPENLRLVRHNAHYEARICPKCNFEWWTR